MNWKIQTCSASGSIPPDTRLAVVGSKPIQPDKYIVWSTITAWLSYISKYSYNFNNTVTYYAPTPRVGGIVIMCIWRLSRRSGLSREQSQWAGGLPSGNLQGWGNIVAASAQLVNAVPNIHWLTCCTVDSGHKKYEHTSNNMAMVRVTVPQFTLLCQDRNLFPKPLYYQTDGYHSESGHCWSRSTIVHRGSPKLGKLQLGYGCIDPP